MRSMITHQERQSAKTGGDRKSGWEELEPASAQIRWRYILEAGKIWRIVRDKAQEISEVNTRKEKK